MSNLRNYEAMLILRPNLSKEETEKVLELLQSIVQEGKGETVKIDRMGKRRIAFEMKKHQEGFYCLVHFKAPGDLIVELERQLKFSESILHFQILRQVENRHRQMKLGKPKAETKSDSTEKTDSAEKEAVKS